MPVKTDARIEKWKQELIDLSRRNSLLFFGSTRSSSLRITEPLPSKVFRRVAIDEKAWKVLAPSEEDAQQVAASETTAAQNTLPLLSGSDAQVVAPKPARKPDEVLCAVKEGQKLRSVLRNLYRRARTDFDERGVRILHLAFGVLEWQQASADETIRSPLIL